MVYSTKRFVLCLILCYFVLLFFRPFRIAITSLGKERANFTALRTFIRFALVWFCLFPLPLGVWEGLQFVIVALLPIFAVKPRYPMNDLTCLFFFFVFFFVFFFLFFFCGRSNDISVSL